MNKIWIVLFLIAINCLNASTNKAYVNIISNVEDTVIFLDGKNIGTTPIQQYEVVPNKPLYLKAVVDKNYYRRNIKTTIKVNSETIPTFSLKFNKATAQIFFVGVSAELYINDKFVKKLNDTNRIVNIKAGKKIKIRLENGDADVEYIKDIKAKTINTLKYKLITIHKDVRLYTSIINELMWEDTKDAANTNINWSKANTYCADLKIANYEDFRLPSIDELQELYENKDKIYNGFGGKFYWSDESFQDEKKIWNYAIGKNFEDGTNQKSIQEFEQARVRCVRDIEIKNNKVEHE